jgi:kynurenine formamidase
MIIDLTHPLDSNIPVYPGDPLFSCQQSSTVPRDGFSVHALSCSSHTGTHIDAPSHFFIDGATVDQLPPSAFILPALVLDVSHKKVRECIIWDDVKLMAHRIRAGTAILFHTGWSRYWDQGQSRSTESTASPTAPSNSDSGRPTHHYFDHPWLATDVAERLLALGVRLVGIDTMSPDQSPSPVPSAVLSGSGSGVGTGTDGEEPVSGFGVHRAVLGAGALIAENLTNLDTLLAAQDAGGPDKNVIVSVLPLKIVGCDGSPVRAVAWLQPRGSFS